MFARIPLEQWATCAWKKNAFKCQFKADFIVCWVWMTPVCWGNNKRNWYLDYNIRAHYMYLFVHPQLFILAVAPIQARQHSSRYSISRSLRWTTDQPLTYNVSLIRYSYPNETYRWLLQLLLHWSCTDEAAQMRKCPWDAEVKCLWRIAFEIQTASMWSMLRSITVINESRIDGFALRTVAIASRPAL